MLGWNPGTEQELFTMEELIGAFSLDKVQKAGAKFNPDKARWYNKEYLRMKSCEELADLFIPILEEHGMQIVDCPVCALTAGAELSPEGYDFKNHIFTRDYVLRVVTLIKERATFVADFWSIAPYLFVSPSQYAQFGVDLSAAEKPSNDPRAKVYDNSATAPFLAKDAEKFWKDDIKPLAAQAVAFLCSHADDGSKESIETALEEHIREQGWPMGKVMNCLRLALAGTANGLGIADIVALVGKKELAARMDYINERLG